MTTEPTNLALQLEKVSLTKGAHGSPDDGMCLLEAVAYVAGESFTDHPECVSPVIAGFGRCWNDWLQSDDDRDRLLKPLIPRLIGTRSTEEIEKSRRWMAIDWLVREYTPVWLDLIAALQPHSLALRGLHEIRDLASLVAAQPHLDAADSAARSAADSVARRAAWSPARSTAAWSAAESAAWSAAESVARSAAESVARSAAERDAWRAAECAAWSAAWSAAERALQPAVDQLQQAAIALVNRMIDAGKH